MRRWHNYYLDGHAHFCTSTVADWQPLLVGQSVTALYDEWDKARSVLNVKVLAYVVMPEHYHVVLWAESGDSVQRFLRRTLSGTARRVAPAGGLWKERPRVLPLYTPEVLRVKVSYTHLNPVRRGLCAHPADWEHSSYRQLEMGCADACFLCDDWGGIYVQ